MARLLHVVVPIFAILFVLMLTVATGDNTFILSWINLVLTGLGANFWDPSITTNPILAVNNLKPVSLANAEYYAHFIAAAYCPDVSSWTCPDCSILAGSGVRYNSTVENSTYDTLGFFAVDDTREEIILTYRGTFNLPNILTDITFVQYSLNNTDIKVHTGLYFAQQSLISQVMENLDELIEDNPGYKVVVTGHSLGGSTAALTMFQLKYYGLYTGVNFELYTYGEPRQGNKAYATKFNSFNFPCGRIGNRADLVPHLFPFFLGFLHHANEVFTVDGVTRNCSNTYYEDLSCSDSLGPLYSANDHVIYFDSNINACLFQSPINTLLQFFVNLRPYIQQYQYLITILQLNFYQLSPDIAAILHVFQSPLGK